MSPRLGESPLRGVFYFVSWLAFRPAFRAGLMREQSHSEKHSMKTRIVYIRAAACALAVAMAAAGCAKKQDSFGDFPSVNSGGGSGSQPPPAVSTTKPVSIQIYSVYGNGGAYQTYWTFDETGSTDCGFDLTAGNVTCTVHIPEGELYFSDVTVVMSWLNTKCIAPEFTPYRYFASTSATFSPPWTQGQATDCSKSPLPKDCFGGAAKDMLKEFPKFFSEIWFSDPSDAGVPRNKKYVANSGFSHANGTNRGAVNDISAGKIGSSIADFGAVVYAGASGSATNPIYKGGGDAYIANTYADYEIVCRDQAHDLLPITPSGGPAVTPFDMKIRIRDVDSFTGNTTVNHFGTWKELP